MDSINYYLRVKKADIFLICPYLEAFEGLAAIRTPKPEKGDFATLKLMVSPDFQDDYEKIIANLGRKARLTSSLDSLRSLDPPLSIKDGEGNEFAEGEERGED